LPTILLILSLLLLFLGAARLLRPELTCFLPSVAYPLLVYAQIILLLLTLTTLRQPRVGNVRYETVSINRVDSPHVGGILIPADPDGSMLDFVNSLKHFMESIRVSSYLFFVAISPSPEWWGVAFHTLRVLSRARFLTIAYIPVAFKAPVYGQSAFLHGILDLNIPLMVYDFAANWPLMSRGEDVRGFLRRIIHSFACMKEFPLIAQGAEFQVDQVFEFLRGKLVIPITNINPGFASIPLSEGVENVSNLTTFDLPGEPERIIVITPFKINESYKYPLIRVHGELIPHGEILLLTSPSPFPLPFMILEVRNSESLVEMQALEEGLYISRVPNIIEEREVLRQEVMSR
jgi:hypothetical protein